MNHSILHVFNNEEKFSIPYFKFLRNNAFDLSTHTLFQYSKKTDNYKELGLCVVFSSYFSLFKNIKLLILMFKSDKLILHNLASPWLLIYLYLFPHLTKKVYWVIWGKDLYFYKLLKKKHFHHKVYEYFRRSVFKDIKHIITYVKGDYLLAKKWYKCDAYLHECIMYPSNIYKNINTNEKTHNKTNILVGNSADPSNNHTKIFELLKPYKNTNIQIYCPLSYGNKKYADSVIQEGGEIFKEKFLPIVDFIPSNKYFNFLGEVDIAIFAHKRQQAMGNTITLLGLGKKVYIQKETSSYQLFKDINIKIFDLNNFDLSPMNENCKINNIKTIKQYFSAKRLSSQLKTIFRD